MKKTTLVLFLLFLLYHNVVKAQWSTNNQLSDMNTWSSQPGFISWYGTSVNTPNSQYYGNGIQTVLMSDNRLGAQLVIPTFDNQFFYRRNMAGTWDPWYKIWSSANFDPDEYLSRSMSSIGNSGSANSFSNGYTFAYASSGTPWNGSLISFGGFGGSYDTQINSDYGPNGGRHISFRTMQGDSQTWNSWNEFYHSGNINKADVDFTAQTINCSNVYTSGNLWAKQIKVALTNPFADYVFDKKYKLPSLSSIKSYVQLNHHLPDVPAAKEVAKTGVNLGEMNTLLLKKVEELTLYLIQKDEQLKEQQIKAQKQDKRITALEKALKRE